MEAYRGEARGGDRDKTLVNYKRYKQSKKLKEPALIAIAEAEAIVQYRKTVSYLIEFAESVKEQLRDLSARERGIAIEAIEKQLLHEPLIATRNRKRLRPNQLAAWELRIDDLRVFYEVDSETPNVVRVLAVGRKEGNQLMIGGQEVELT